MKTEKRQWILNLKPGKYTLADVSSLTGVSRPTISQAFSKLHVDKEVVGMQYKNICKVIYDWKGVNFYNKQGENSETI